MDSMADKSFLQTNRDLYHLEEMAVLPFLLNSVVFQVSVRSPVCAGRGKFAQKIQCLPAGFFEPVFLQIDTGGHFPYLTNDGNNPAVFQG